MVTQDIVVLRQGFLTGFTEEAELPLDERLKEDVVRDIVKLRTPSTTTFEWNQQTLTIQ